MSGYGKHPPLHLASDPSDLVWHWFILNGPHGESFAWHREAPKGPTNLELLAKFIERNSETNPRFRARAREIALEALAMDDATLVRTGIQVLTVVGSDEDMTRVRELLGHRNKTVVKDARAALFERRIR